MSHGIRFRPVSFAFLNACPFKGLFFLSIFVLGKEGLQCKGNVNTHGVISVYGLALFASSLNTAIFHRHLFSHQEAPAAPNY